MDLKLIDWEGGEMPVEHGARVLVVHRDGEIFIARAGKEGAAFDWTHDGIDGDIIAYMEAPINIEF